MGCDAVRRDACGQDLDVVAGGGDRIVALVNQSPAVFQPQMPPLALAGTGYPAVGAIVTVPFLDVNGLHTGFRPPPTNATPPLPFTLAGAAAHGSFAPTGPGAFNVSAQLGAADLEWPWRGLAYNLTLVHPAGNVTVAAGAVAPGAVWTVPVAGGGLPEAALPPAASTHAWVDVNEDGALDVLVVTPAGGLTLLLASGGGQFVNATEARGLPTSLGAAVALLQMVDVVQPAGAPLGAVDILVVLTNGTVCLFANTGGGQFVGVSAEARGLGASTTGAVLVGAGDGSGVSVLDVDGDGDVDLVLTPGTARGLHLQLNNGTGGFGPPVAVVGTVGGVALGVNMSVASFTLLDQDFRLDLLLVPVSGWVDVVVVICTALLVGVSTCLWRVVAPDCVPLPLFPQTHTRTRWVPFPPPPAPQPTRHVHVYVDVVRCAFPAPHLPRPLFASSKLSQALSRSCACACAPPAVGRQR
jgi:hypothetical protein